MRRLVFRRRARENLVDILDYITRESGSERRGRAFTDRIKAQCQRLAELPGALGRPRPDLRPGIRSYPFQGYLILFRYTDDAVEIINIIEGHRDIPGAMEP